MTMLDRYLYAVQSQLPKDQPARDIVAEIGDDLQSQIDEREAELGRALTDDECAGLIKAYGHPSVVAARYGRVQSLIGPDLLPFYWSTLRLVATIVIAIELLGGAIAALARHDGVLFFDALAAAWNSLIWIFGIVTIVFALGERAPRRDGQRAAFIPFTWDPRRLPAPGTHPPVPRFSALAEFIANFVALLVLLDAPGSPHRVPLDAVAASLLQSLHATLTPAWHAAFIGTLAGTALIAASSFVLFLRPQLSVLHECVRVIASVAVIIGVGFTLQAGPWIESPNAALNTAALYTLAAAIVVLALQVVVSLRTLLRKPHIPAHTELTQP